jgi:hypothetical protein
MTAHREVVTITVKPGVGGHLLEFKATKKTIKPVEVTLPGDKLETARSEVAYALERFMDEVTNELRPDHERVVRALRELHRRMFSIGGGLMKQGSTGMAEIRKLFVQAWPSWKNPSARVPLVIVQVEDKNGIAEDVNYFPFELLPVFDHREVDGIADRIGLVKYARRFLGSTCAVRRTRGRLGDGKNLPSSPLLLTLLHHAGLPGAALETEFFDGARPHVDVDGPWPQPGLSEDDVVNGVVNVLFDPRRRVLAKPNGDPVQIHHFACHCETWGASVDYALVLAGEDEEDRLVALHRLDSGYGDRLQDLEEHGSASKTRTDGALVFLNACGSAFMDPARVTSFPQWFLRNGHRGVIGTETVIPDEVAAHYARCFYRELLTGTSLGSALVKARLHLLSEFGNPLGLLYVLYADPHITVEDPVPLGVFEKGSRREI